MVRYRDQDLTSPGHEMVNCCQSLSPNELLNLTSISYIDPTKPIGEPSGPTSQDTGHMLGIWICPTDQPKLSNTKNGR